MTMKHHHCSVLLLINSCFVGFLSFPAHGAQKKYQFDIQVKNVSSLCHAKPIVTVNGMLPEGDRVLVNVTNRAQYNMSIHWHGLKQYRNGWADGPAYITQCPIKTGNSYTYDFNVTGQRRNPGVACSYFVAKGHSLWCNFNKLGLPPPTLDAHTINGKPGPLFPCSEKHTFAMEVESGTTYFLRIVNAALNDELFFAIAGHNMTVVEIDAVYTKPFTTQAILIASGQTTNVLVKADQSPSRYFMAATPSMDAPITVDNKTVTAILQYKGIPNTVVPILLTLPAPNDTNFALNYNSKLRSLNTPQYPANVPLQVDRHLFYTIGLGQNPCSPFQNGTQLTASLNNITFVMPKIGLLQAHYFNISGVFRTDFPDRPPVPFNYTGAPLTANLGTSLGTRLSKSHPFHLHGYNFFVVGSGIGNFDPKKDPAKFNLVDPPERNTVGVPTGGWSAIRFRADNPGVWFMHCHLELHTMWGLNMAFVVENGNSPEQSVLPPPKDLPPC
ncbi:Laccase [Melia azedarach]|uniref:Laccase n=1 Tax=Melia azedarach TaxID=155640 RepID=A0ACC1X0P3_MELAZ|nr:Laccase [Melia azedarach]